MKKSEAGILGFYRSSKLARQRRKPRSFFVGYAGKNCWH